VYGLAFAYMELGDIEQVKEHFIRVLEIEAPEDLRGLESHVLRALPERVTFLRWSLQGHLMNMPLAFSGLPASSPRPFCLWGRSLLAVDVDAEPTPLSASSVIF
jgi:hypothetical protein